MLDSQDQVRFETLVLPHLDAAFNLARWLLRSGADAEDAAQEAMLRAYRFFHGFHGGDVRAWLLQIVRNTCFTWLDKNRRGKDMTEFDETLHGPSGPTPEALAMTSDSHGRLTQALDSLPPRFREVIVLRELEGLFLQGDCHHYFHSYWYRHVHPFPCPPCSFSVALLDPDHKEIVNEL